MKRHDAVTAARLALELVLAITGSRLAFAADAYTPPALSCELVAAPQAARPRPEAGAPPADPA
jgi:hypothetical protein